MALAWGASITQVQILSSRPFLRYANKPKNPDPGLDPCPGAGNHEAQMDRITKSGSRYRRRASEAGLVGEALPQLETSSMATSARRDSRTQPQLRPASDRVDPTLIFIARLAQMA